MSGAGAAAFAALAVNPIGGATIAIPFAVFELGWGPWRAAALCAPLGYLQVVAVDLFWEGLLRWKFFRTLTEKRRSAIAERILSSGGAFWPTLIFSPIVGPWLVMALMRYARVPQSKVAAPMMLGLAWWNSALAWACVLAPRLFGR